MRVGVHGADRQPSSESAVRGGTRRFLTAEWRDLAMLSYQVDPGILADRVPLGTMLDSFEGRHFVSVVGFRFIDTRVFGIPVPFHRDFDEVNLRFYVRRETGAGARRGVVFVKEIVPRVAITNIARWVYNENYVAMPMRSEIRRPTPKESPVGLFEYGWGSPRSVAPHEGADLGDGRLAARGIARDVLCRALLGVWGAPGWKHSRVRGRTPAVAIVACGRGESALCCETSLRTRVRCRSPRPAGVGLRSLGLRGVGAPAGQAVRGVGLARRVLAREFVIVLRLYPTTHAGYEELVLLIGQVPHVEIRYEAVE